MPGSRLLLKASGLTDPQVHEALLARVTRAAIDPKRLTLLGFTPKNEHLASYAMVDVRRSAPVQRGDDDG